MQIALEWVTNNRLFLNMSKTKSIVFGTNHCPMIWSSAAKKDLGKLQLVQNRAAHLALQCPLRSNVNNMHVKLSWLKVAERLSASLLAFVRNMNEEKIPNCVYSQLTFSSNSHEYSTRHATSGLFKVRARTQSMQRTVLYRGMVAWNSLPAEIAKAHNKSIFKKQVKEHLR